MTKQTEAMKLALEALEKADRHCPVNTEAEVFVRLSITALQEALAEQKSGIKQVIELYDSPDQPAQPQQDPFIYYRHYDGGTQDFPDEKTIPLYTSPPAQRTWVGLTDEEYREAEKAVWAVISLDDTEKEANSEFYEAIEAKLKEKNT
jgi:hypothetical protein